MFGTPTRLTTLLKAVFYQKNGPWFLLEAKRDSCICKKRKVLGETTLRLYSPFQGCCKKMLKDLCAHRMVKDSMGAHPRDKVSQAWPGQDFSKSGSLNIRKFGTQKISNMTWIEMKTHVAQNSCICSWYIWISIKHILGYWVPNHWCWPLCPWPPVESLTIQWAHGL